MFSILYIFVLFQGGTKGKKAKGSRAQGSKSRGISKDRGKAKQRNKSGKKKKKGGWNQKTHFVFYLWIKNVDLYPKSDIYVIDFKHFSAVQKSFH